MSWTTDPVQHPYCVDVSSNFGTHRQVYFEYCRKTFGRKRAIWDMADYMWRYRFYFKNEEHAMMFALKWVK